MFPDYLSVSYDYDLIDIVDKTWENITIVRFASYKKHKSKRFNSRYLSPETEGANAFSLDWSNEFNFPLILQVKQYTTFLPLPLKPEQYLVCPH